MGQGEAGMRNSHTRPTPASLIFFNGIGMGIILNKWIRVGMG